MDWKRKLIESGLWKSLIYLLAISLMFGIVLLMAFTDGDLFDLSKLKNPSFWLTYVITIALAIGVLMFGLMFKKDSLKGKSKIEDEKRALRALDKTIIDNGLYDEFSAAVKELHSTRVKQKHRRYLMRKKAAAKTQAEQDLCAALIKELDEKPYDPMTAPVKTEAITTNTIFDGVDAQDDGDELIYTGLEKIGVWIFPMMIVGLFFTMIFLTLSEPTQKGLTMETAFMLMMRLYVMASYLLTGMRYADYSVNTVYYNVLVGRKDFVLKFFKKNGLTVEIAGTPQYTVKTEAGNGNL